ncbi:MAG: hypothetical protein ACTTJC_03860 [Campylobacter sp.]
MHFNENLTEVFILAKSIHIYIVLIILALILIHFCLVNFGINSPNYAKRIKLFLPTYYGFLAAMILTGLLLMSAFYFQLSLKSAIMIVAVTLLIGLGAVEFKKLKQAMIKKNFTDFRQKMRIKVAVDFALILIASGVR